MWSYSRIPVFPYSRIPVFRALPTGTDVYSTVMYFGYTHAAVCEAIITVALAV